MKNIILSVMISILLISCSSLKSITKEPEVKFDSVKITNINFTAADFIFKYKVENPNSVSLNVEKFKYDLFIENNKFLSGVSAAPVSIAKKSSSYVDIPVTVSYQELFKIYNNIYKQDTANYKLATEFTLNLPIFGKKTFPVDFNGAFPVLKIPEMTLRDVKIVSLNPISSTIEFTVDIINRNSFAISPDSFNFELYINKSQWLKGLLKNIEALQPGKSATVKIPLEINTLIAGKELLDNIIGGNNLDVVLKGNMAMRTSYPGIGQTNMPFSIEKAIPVKK